MTPDELDTVTKVMQSAVKSARESVPKKSNVLDKANLIVTVLAFIAIPACALIISQQISIEVGKLESADKDTYVDKPTYSSDKAQAWEKMQQQDDHINAVDTRENSDKAQEDLKIQSLQDRAIRSTNYNE